MQIFENYPLKSLNTFGIDVSAKYFVNIENVAELSDLLCNKNFKDIPKFILGGGSNVLFTNNYNGIVVKIDIKGINIIEENDEYVIVKANAGEVWDDFVKYCVDNNFGGIENLSLIPGNVGSCPVQNIGAYGSEIKDTFYELEAIDIKTNEKIIFKNSDCNFGYRNSVFKNKYKGKYIITSVSFKLTKKHILNIDYEDLKKELSGINIENITIKLIRDCICKIRNSKLPSYTEIGNAGSFFKNPVIDILTYNKLKHNYPEIKAYKQNDNEYKVAAGWLIEQCGYKGYRKGDVGVHTKQALVLVNYGNACGKDIINLAEEIKKIVKDKFEIDIEFEVNIL